MKRMIIVLAVVTLFLVLVVAPVAVGSSARAESSLTSTEDTEATMAATEAIREIVTEPVATEIANTEFNEAKDEFTDVAFATESNDESYSEDYVQDELYEDENIGTDAVENDGDMYDCGGVGVYDYSYSDADLDLLARLIWVENGCEWIPDWVQFFTGSVVLNRVNSPLYADSIEGVIYEPGQYVPSLLYNSTPDERTYNNARQLLEGGSVLPADVLGQNGFNCGDGTYAVYYDEVLGSTEYFTYVYG